MPSYGLHNVEVIELYGDGDDNVDRGETWYFSLNLENLGGANGEDIYIQIETTNEFVDFYYGYNPDYQNLSVDTLDSGNNKTIIDFSYWRFEISDQILQNSNITFKITIIDASEHQWVEYFKISIIEGRLISAHLIRVIGWVLVGSIASILVIRSIYRNPQKIIKYWRFIST